MSAHFAENSKAPKQKLRRGSFTKGRHPDPAAISEINDLTGSGPLPHDQLIECLHKIQDTFNGLSDRHLCALAERIGMSQAEVFEVASFYAHFDVPKAGSAPPPPITLRVCNGPACTMKGGPQQIGTLQDILGQDILDKSVRVIKAPCSGACHKAPAARLNKLEIAPIDPGRIKAVALSGDTAPDIVTGESLASYRARGGTKIVAACRSGEIKREEVMSTIEASGLRGLGGGGFPVATKWGFLQKAPEDRILVVNADEGEPGTFKDRHCLETAPHQVLEGALIAAWTVQASRIYIYLRDEYAGIHAALMDEIDALRDAGLSDGVEINLRRGAGSYICGEETALLESLEGKRGLPRIRPPYPAEAGLFGRPTLINNIETLYWVPEILKKGAEWYQAEGRPRLYSVSGRIASPGVKRAPSGTTARQLIKDHSGGMADGHEFYAYMPGGASGGILPASLGDLPLDFDQLNDYGCFVGSGAVIVLSDQDDIKSMVSDTIRFFADESCGQCTPCRIGCDRMAGLLENPRSNETLIRELSSVMRDASICGLGQAAPNPVLSLLRFFPEALK